MSLCCLNNTGKWELRVLFSPLAVHSAVALSQVVGAPPGVGIFLVNMERDALKREEFEMNRHGDVEVGSIMAGLDSPLFPIIMVLVLIPG